MKYTYADIKKSLTKKKNSRSSYWVQLWVRKASFPLTYLFINFGWTANMVSLLSWLVIFMGAIFISINNFYFILAGIILTNLWLILDCVDGNIARCKKQKSFMGDFYDAIAGYGPFAFTTIALGIAAFNTSTLFSNYLENWVFILIGGIGAMANLYTRLIHQKYMNCFFVANKEIKQLENINLTDEENKKSFAYIREQVDKNFGVSGLFMPLLFVALFTNTFDIMVTMYTAYYVLSFVAVIFLYCKKATTFENYAKHIKEEVVDK